MSTTNKVRALLKILLNFGISAANQSRRSLGPAFDRLNLLKREQRRTSKMIFADDPIVEKFIADCAQVEIETPPPILFHYTTETSLHAIANSKQVWATHILDMRNDAAEFSHGLTMFSAGLDQLEKLGVDAVLSNSLKGFMREEMKNPLAAPCVFCFTTIRDGNGQWTEYANGGQGICIGIETQSSSSAFKNVLYDEHTQQRIVAEVVRKFVSSIQELYRSGVDPNDTSYVRALALAYFQSAYLQSIRFKRSSFNHEKEWRVVEIVSQQRLRSRPATEPDKVIRFVPIDLDLLSRAKELIAGPSMKTESRKTLKDRFCTETQFSISNLKK